MSVDIKLEHNCVVWTDPGGGPMGCTLTDPKLMIFNVRGWLYAENGQPIPTLLIAPTITGVVNAQAALDYGLRHEYDPNAGYKRRDENGMRK